ncbi:wdr85, partial [Symbiodinium necroappetens]
LQRDVVAYNAAISSCEKCGQWHVALAVLAKMRASMVAPDIITYAAAISACENAEQWEEALVLLGQLHSFRLSANLITYSAAISACEKGAKWQLALALFHQMRSQLLLPDLIVFNATILSCASAGLWQPTLVLLTELRRQMLPPGVQCFSAITGACTKGRQMARACDVALAVEQTTLRLLRGVRATFVQLKLAYFALAKLLEAQRAEFWTMPPQQGGKGRKGKGARSSGERGHVALPGFQFQCGLMWTPIEAGGTLVNCSDWEDDRIQLRRAEASEAVERRDAFAVKASRYVPWNINLHGAMDPLHLMELKGEVFESCEIYPDVVEFCPCGDEACLAWGTYEHVEETNQRKGALVFASIEQCDQSHQYSLLRTQVIESPGVYDIAWGPDGSVLATACADGCVRLCSQSRGVLHEASNVSEQILTHLCFGAGGDGLAAVGQDGKCYHLKLDASGFQKLAEKQQHDLEAWCVDVSPAEPDLVLSGADDGHVAVWDVREPDAPALRNRRSHEAGVTALAFNPFNPLQVASGSYDERLRLFDLRKLTAEPVAKTGRLGDGAYQIAWHPRWRGILAVAAMRCGFPLFRLDDAGFECLTAYAADAPEGTHGSLGYGISWQFAASSETSLAASASFYDRSVHLWTVRQGFDTFDTAAVSKQVTALVGGEQDVTMIGRARFNAQETADWISSRYQAVMEDYEKQKSGNKSIHHFSDLTPVNAWGSGAKPVAVLRVLPGKEDFLQQLQTALLHFQRARQGEEANAIVDVYNSGLSERASVLKRSTKSWIPFAPTPRWIQLPDNLNSVFALPLRQPVMSSGVPYIGSKISLITTSDMRYEGFLRTLNREESTIAVESVRSFGTEGRADQTRGQSEIPVSNEIYDFIVFRGKDLKDLTVLQGIPENAPQPQPAPATRPPAQSPHMQGSYGQHLNKKNIEYDTGPGMYHPSQMAPSGPMGEGPSGGFGSSGYQRHSPPAVSRNGYGPPPSSCGGAGVGHMGDSLGGSYLSSTGSRPPSEKSGYAQVRIEAPSRTPPSYHDGPHGPPPSYVERPAPSQYE